MSSFSPKARPDIVIAARPLKQARRLTLRVDARSGDLTISHPKRMRGSAIQEFIDSRVDWIAEKHHPQVTLIFGDEVEILGTTYVLSSNDSKRGEARDGNLHLRPSADGSALPALRAHLKTVARDFATPRLDAYAAQVARPVSAIRWRDSKSRWGSCGSDGAIMLSWRLALAPVHVFDYVIAHEVAHRVEMNHSAAYWRIVEKLRPDFEVSRTWLKSNGRQLQRMGL